MSLRAQNIDFRKRFQWALEIDSPNGPINIAQIMKCAFPEAEIDKSEIKQAGALHSIKNPGMVKYSDIEFERVLLSQGADLQIHLWFQLAANPITGTGLRPSKVKRTVDLVHLNDEGVAIERWKLNGAWVSKMSGEGQEGSSDAFMEKVTLTYDSYERLAA